MGGGFEGKGVSTVSQDFLFAESEARQRQKTLIPLSCLEGTAADAFGKVLAFHLDGDRVLDVTYGMGLSWRGLQEPSGLVKSDRVALYGQDLFTACADRLDWREAFDLVYYDPPYFAGVVTSDDPRAEAYGGYDADLRRYMAATPSLAGFLRPGGKLILKCGDQFDVRDRRLHLYHLDWIAAMAPAFEVVDFYVYRYHRVSPTAYQVKNRPCAVVMHSYFIVGQRRGVL